MDKILKVAKRLKTFTLEDIVMFCDIDAKTAEDFIQKSENIKPVGNKFEYYSNRCLYFIFKCKSKPKYKTKYC